MSNYYYIFSLQMRHLLSQWTRFKTRKLQGQWKCGFSTRWCYGNKLGSETCQRRQWRSSHPANCLVIYGHSERSNLFHDVRTKNRSHKWLRFKLQIRYNLDFMEPTKWQGNNVNNRIYHFTVTGGNAAGVDLAVLLFKSCCFYANWYFFKHNFHKKWFHVLYQNKVNLSLTFTQRLVYQAHNCKMVNQKQQLPLFAQL